MGSGMAVGSGKLAGSGRQRQAGGRHGGHGMTAAGWRGCAISLQSYLLPVVSIHLVYVFHSSF